MSDSFDFDTPVERRGTDSEKWQRWAGRDVLPLWVADMDFAAPPPVVAALRERVGHGVFGYALPDADHGQAVVDALAHLGVRHVDLPCSPERVLEALRDATAGEDPGTLAYAP